MFIALDSAVYHVVVCFIELILNTEEIICILMSITGLFITMKIGRGNQNKGNGRLNYLV